MVQGLIHPFGMDSNELSQFHLLVLRHSYQMRLDSICSRNATHTHHGHHIVSLPVDRGSRGRWRE